MTAPRTAPVEPPGRRPRGRLRTLVMLAGELALALVLVALFFLAFLGIYSVSFPEGTSIAAVVRTPDDPARGGALRLALGPGSAESPTSFVAMLDDVERKVRDKPPEAVVWSVSQTGTPLAAGHAVHSHESSSASVRFDADNELRLGENTLIVVRDLTRRADAGRRTATVVVVGGELSGRLGPSRDDAPLVSIVATAHAELTVEPTDGERPTEFQMVARSDDSATFRILDGVARLRAGDRAIELRGGQSIEVDPAGRLGAVMQLPAALRATRPAPGASFAYRNLPPVVEFAWDGPTASGPYEIVIARDPGFRDIVHRSILDEPEFRHGNLKPGHYSWRVRELAGPDPAPDAVAPSFVIRRDVEPPTLEVRFPQGPLAVPRCGVSGRTEPGAEVLVSATRVAVRPDGRFEHELALRPGLNVVVVEALDPAGNVAYRSRLLRVRSPEQESLR